MTNPCKECIVLSMCTKECWHLMKYIDQQVSEASGIGDFECSMAWLHAMGRRLLKEKSFTHVICIQDSYYCMMIRDRDIQVVDERNPWRWFNNRQPWSIKL